MQERLQNLSFPQKKHVVFLKLVTGILTGWVLSVWLKKGLFKRKNAGSLAVTFLFILVNAINVLGQAPAVMYLPASYTYTTNTAITTVSPMVVGTVPATTYGSVSTLVSSGLNTPWGLAYDGTWLYEADLYGNVIYKINPSTGAKTIFAGTGAATETDNATGTLATLAGPASITWDGSTTGYLYVADFLGNTIRKISLTGTNAVTTLAGTALTPGEVDGSSTTAQFNSPFGIAYTSTYIYVTDFVGNSIRKINKTTGATTTLVNSGLTGPAGILIDAAGTNMYLAEFTGNTIKKVVVSSGVTTTICANTTGLLSPVTLAFDNTSTTPNLIISDSGNGQIKTTPTTGGTPTVVSGTGTQGEVDGLRTSAQFMAPFAMCTGTGANAGTLYVSENNSTSSTIRKVALFGYSITPDIAANTGLTFDGTSGKISGTPTVPTNAVAYTVSAFNASGKGTAALTVTVSPVAPTISGSNTLCGSQLSTLICSEGTATTGTYNWYSAATGGTLLYSGKTLTFFFAINYDLYIDYTVPGGATSSRTHLTVTVNPTEGSRPTIPSESYTFDSASPTDDVSGNYNTAILQGSPTLVDDRYGNATSAYLLNGSSQYITTTTNMSAASRPTDFTVSLWFKTTSTTGGKLIGYGSSQTGASAQTDRHIYMTNAGTLIYGLYDGSANKTIVSPKSYNDGLWHHVAVTTSTTAGVGSVLYIDEVAVATDVTMTTARNAAGYWRIGYDNLTGWTSAPTSSYFAGTIDDIDIYGAAGSAAQITALNGATSTASPSAPVCPGTSVTLSATAVTGATSYVWSGPNGFTASTQNVTISSPTAANTGNYTLTVTTSAGCTSYAMASVSILSPPVATFTTSATTVAVNTNVTITYTGSGGSTYAWTVNGGTYTGSLTTSTGPGNVQWSTSGVKTITLTVTNSNGCSSTISQYITVGTAGTAASTYAMVMPITLSTTALPLTTTPLLNFPVLIKISDPTLISVSGACNNIIQNPGGPYYDFGFVDPSTGNELNYDVESYDAAAGTLVVWVRMASLSSTANTLLFCYGASSVPATHVASFYQTTWSAYNGVWHFSQTPSTASATLLDATSGGVNLKAYTSGTVSQNTSSLFGNGIQLATSNVSAAATGYPDLTTALSMSFWAKYSATPSTTSQNMMVIKGASSNADQVAYRGSANAAVSKSGGAIVVGNSSAFAVSSGWHHFVYTHLTGSTGTNSLYIDGALVSPATTTATQAGAITNVFFGDYANATGENFNGYLDEARICSSTLSANWIAVEYANQSKYVSGTTYLTQGSITANPAAAAIKGALSYTWTGATSTDPAVATNWSTNTPSSTTGTLPSFTGNATLFIFSGQARYPSLTANASIYGLTLDNSATLNLNGRTLSVGCNVVNSSGGQILYGSNTASGLTFNGTSSTQSYTGSSSANTATLGNLTINNSAGGTVTITGGPVDIYNTVTLTKGNLTIDATSTFTLKSSASLTASVAAIVSPYAISGTVVAERYIPGGSASSRGYRLLSSPLSSTTIFSIKGYTLNSLLSNTIITGPGTGGSGITSANTNGFDVTPTGNPSAFVYKESDTDPIYRAITSSDFKGFASTGQVLPLGSGILLFYRGDRTLAQAGNNSASVFTSPYPYANATTLKFSGSVNSGPITAYAPTWSSTANYFNDGITAFTPSNTQTVTAFTPSLSYTSNSSANDGLNLLGNPFPSTIDLEGLTFGSGITSTVYTLNGAAQTYGTYVRSGSTSTDGVALNGASRYVLSGEGFFVQAKSTGTKTVTFPEAAKATYPSASYIPTVFSLVNKNAGIRIRLVQDSVLYNESLITFNSQNTGKFEEGIDVSYLSAPSQQVFMYSYTDDNAPVVVNRMNALETVKTIKLYAEGGVSGTYQMQFSGVNTIDSHYIIYLKDAVTNDSVNIAVTPVYQYTINRSNPATYGANRFTLVVHNDTDGKYQLLTFSGARIMKAVKLSWTTKNESDVITWELQRSIDGGKTYVTLGNVQASKTGTYTFTDTSPVLGQNIYRLKQSDVNDDVTYSDLVSFTFDGNAPVAVNTVTMYPNPADTKTTISITEKVVNPMQVNIVSTSGKMVKQITVNAAQHFDIDVSTLQTGVYVVDIFDATTHQKISSSKLIKN